MRYRGGDISADSRFPMETYFGVLYCGTNYSDPYSLPQKFPFASDWGKSTTEVILINKLSFEFKSIEIAWLSLVERKFYYFDSTLNNPIESEPNQADNEENPKLIAGLAPGGKIALLVDYGNCSVLSQWSEATEIQIPMSDFMPSNPSIGIERYCMDMLGECNKSKLFCEPDLKKHIEIFWKRMQQYSYRVQINFEKWEDDVWNKSNLRPLNVTLKSKFIDGTYDNRNNEWFQMCKSHGKPHRLLLNWLIAKTEFEVYFWLDENKVCECFSRFYGAHPDTKSDFIIRIDAENKKYELALYRQGLKEPMVIPESAYQLIVFRNKFEDYRSENYNQPRGAWIW